MLETCSVDPLAARPAEAHVKPGLALGLALDAQAVASLCQMNRHKPPLGAARPILRLAIHENAQLCGPVELELIHVVRGNREPSFDCEFAIVRNAGFREPVASGLLDDCRRAAHGRDTKAIR